MHPSASSCFLLFFYFSFPPYKKCQKNSGRNTGKISVQEASRRAREGPEGSQGGPGGHPAWPHPWPRQGGAWGPWSTSGCPPSPIYPPSRENSRGEPYSANSPLFRRRRASKIGSTRRPLPDTLPEGGLTSGIFSTTMDASQIF